MRQSLYTLVWTAGYSRVSERYDAQHSTRVLQTAAVTLYDWLREVLALSSFVKPRFSFEIEVDSDAL